MKEKKKKTAGKDANEEELFRLEKCKRQNANYALLNVAASGVVTQSPAPEARDQYDRRHRFWRKR